VGIAGGDFQVATGSVISTAFRVAAHQMGSEANGYRAAQVLVNGHGLAGPGVFPAALKLALMKRPTQGGHRFELMSPGPRVHLTRRRPFNIAWC
jgi:hypothetical protein